MLHLNINFIRNHIGDPPTDAIDNDLTFPFHTDERNRRLREICSLQPELHIDNTCLNSMPAILTYLAAISDAPDLAMGDNYEETAKLIDWLSFLEAKVYGLAFKVISTSEQFIGAGSGHGRIVQRAYFLLEHYFAGIEARLVDRVFVLSARPTVVDFSLYVFARWYKELWPEVDFNTRFPKYCRVMRYVEWLPGVATAVEEHGKMILFQ